MNSIYKSIEMITITTKRIVLLVLEDRDYHDLRKSFEGAGVPAHANTILGVPFIVGEGGQSYAIEDTLDGPLFHWL